MEYTGFWRRLCAKIIDGLILMIPSLLVGGGTPASIGIGVILSLLYGAIYESSVLCATPGKALMHMIVLSEAGERLTFKAAVIRNLGQYISIFTCYIGYIMQIFTKKRQTLHDILSESVVIDRNSPDLNYFTVWVDQFKVIVNKL